MGRRKGTYNLILDIYCTFGITEKCEGVGYAWNSDSV